MEVECGTPILFLPQPREQERKLQQEKLSGVVKSVHRRLRKKYREGNKVRVLTRPLTPQRADLHRGMRENGIQGQVRPLVLAPHRFGRDLGLGTAHLSSLGPGTEG